MNIILKLECILIFIFSAGCAKNMIIDSTLLAGSTSQLTVEAPELKDFPAVPLMSHKFIGIRLFTEEQACKDKFSYNSGDAFGYARLTGASHIQTFMIPAEKRIFITTKVDENIGGNIKTCSGVLEFLPEKNKTYTFNIKSLNTKSFKFGVYSCTTTLTESNVIGDLNIQPRNFKLYLPTKWGEVPDSIKCDSVTKP
ncbi:MAG: hypothetical protein K6L75_15675 [Cellvibrionaceae bacterium]